MSVAGRWGFGMSWGRSVGHSVGRLHIFVGNNDARFATVVVVGFGGFARLVNFRCVYYSLG